MLQAVNQRVGFNYPGVLMIAEESTSFPGVTRPVDMGGLGFHYKWNMGWMNDTLAYMERDPIYRQYHQDQLTFGLVYAFSENFVLPLSHDEVVHGKGSLLTKMPGDDWQQFANLRAYLTFMWSHPGKKLLFMGGEFAQRAEWNHNTSLDWHLLDAPAHAGISELIKDLNASLTAFPALYQQDCSHEGFEWLQIDNAAQSVLAWLRRDVQGNTVVVTANLTPQYHADYRIGVPSGGSLVERFNSDQTRYGGSGQLNAEVINIEAIEANGRAHSASVALAPLAVQIFELKS